MSALDTVLTADAKRTELMAECKKLEKEQEDGKDVVEKLNHVYDELRAIGADQVSKGTDYLSKHSVRFATLFLTVTPLNMVKKIARGIPE